MFYTEPLPQLQSVSIPGSAEASYYTWVDQFNTLGLGRKFKDGSWFVHSRTWPFQPHFNSQFPHGKMQVAETRR